MYGFMALGVDQRDHTGVPSPTMPPYPYLTDNSTFVANEDKDDDKQENGNRLESKWMFYSVSYLL